MKKVLLSILSAVMMFSSVQSINIVKAQDTSETDAANVSIYPKPQSIETHSTDGMKLIGDVEILVHGTQDEATLPKLKGLLEEEGISYSEVNELTGKAAIILATQCSDSSCEICDPQSDKAQALTHEQGYVLESGNDENANGQIKIVGTDKDGVYYGVMSLIQLLDQKNSEGYFAEVSISDYPDVLFRGYVEGFYGIPWTFEDRANLFKDTSLYKMTTYIYAPKDDPYHRGSWRDLYPEEEAEHIRELSEIAAENNMEFCWTVHPGADYNYSSDSDNNGIVDDFERMIAKLEQVYSLGVRQFGIFYDDLDYGVANGNQHANVINSAYEYLTNKYDDVKPFITVVTRYTNNWGAPWGSYFTPFMQNIHRDTIVLWTGTSTMSAITRDCMEYPQRMTGIDRDLGVWWNFPVTDYCYGKMLMGSLDCLSNDVDNIVSFFLNPMSEADASKVAIYSGADYSWNIQDFDSKESWKRAIKELVPECNEAFERFADNLAHNNQGSGFFFDESVYLADKLEAFNNALSSGLTLEDVKVLKDEFQLMVDDVAELRAIENELLAEELESHINAYESVAKAGLSAMQAFEGALNGNMALVSEKSALIDKYLEESLTFKIKTINGLVGCSVGEYRIKPFINSVKTSIMDVLNENLSYNIKERMISDIIELDLQSVNISDSIYSLPDIETQMKENQYVGISLPEVSNLYTVSVTLNNPESAKLQYSLNGIDYYDLDYTVEGNTLVSTEIVTGAYARVVAQSAGEFTIEDFSIDTQKPSDAQVSAGTDMNNNNITNIIDNSLSTVYSSDEFNNGNYIYVDLEDFVSLFDTSVYFGENTLKEVKLETSLDNRTWKDAGTISSADYITSGSNKAAKFILQGDLARYIRFSAVSDHNNEINIAEVKYNETSSETVTGSVSTNLGTYEYYSISNAMDGNMNSKYYSSSGTSIGDYVQVTLNKETTVNDVTVYFGGNPQVTGAVDGFLGMNVQVSSDGVNWTTAGSIDSSEYKVVDGKYIANISLTGAPAKYVKLVSTKAGDSWVQIYEIEFNKSTDSNNIRYVEPLSSVTINRSDYLDDGNSSTAPYINEIAQDDYLVYPASTVTNVKTLAILADETDAVIEVSVLNKDDTWTSVGQLEGTWNEFVIEDTIKAVKLSYDGNDNPKIYEILIRGYAKYDRIDAIKATIPADLENYTEDSVAALNEVLDTIDYKVGADNQAVVDAYEPALKAAINALVEVEKPEEPVKKPFPFTDVSEKQWYYGVIDEAYQLGLLTGATETLFKPNANMNRAMVACVFHRMEGSKPTAWQAVFSDVISGEYYSGPVTWAKLNGVINGYKNGTYKPLQNITREEMATMIYNFAKYKGLDVSATQDITGYTDYAKITPYARVTLQWTVENGLMSGKLNGTKLDPLGLTTRAEASKMLVNAYKVIYK